MTQSSFPLSCYFFKNLLFSVEDVMQAEIQNCIFHLWFMPVILVTQEQRTGGSWLKASPGK
jgi:hypothetical protein